MNDLISRSELNDVIDGLEVYTSDRPNAMKVEISVLQLQRFINKLKNIPTAYALNEVVEELENERKFWENSYDYHVGKEKSRSYAHAIEIVKQGGVRKEVN